MIDLYRHQIRLAKNLSTVHEQFNHVVSILRSVLQYSAIAAYEQFSQLGQLDPYESATILSSLRNLNDTTPVDVLNRLIPHIRHTTNTKYCHGWFENSVSDGRNETPLSTQLRSWVAFRNLTHHTIADRATVERHLPTLYHYAEQSLQVLEDALPSVSDGTLLHTINGTTFASKTLPLHDGDPVVIRRIRSRRNIWFAEYRALNFEEAEDGVLRLDESPLLTSVELSSSGFRTCRIPIHTPAGPPWMWVTDAFLPNRQTFTFRGREEQMSELLEWYNDESSRMCQVFGDGGIGKTTIVLEFLHNILEGPWPEVDWFPEIVCFYTAKLTRWSAEGLEHLPTVRPVVLADALYRLVSLVEDKLDSSWYGLEGRQLVDRVAQLWHDVGVDSSKVLLIVDNAETLARRPSDEKNLHSFLRQISRKVARIIVTSRRYEKIEAHPIEVKGLDAGSAVDLLRDLAVEDSAHPLLQAGEATLEDLARGLNFKPLLLEAVSKYLQHRGVSIQDARRRVQSAVRIDLGEFLYEDAWERIESANRDVFMILAELRIRINKEVVGWACREVDATHEGWLDAFLETNFGQLTEYGTDYEIVFVPEAVTYFQTKKTELMRQFRLKAIRLEDATARVRSLHRQLQEGEAADVTDRISAAFVTGAAKAAKLHANRGDYDDAEMWYEEATALEPHNSCLFDRYAYFLMHYRKRIDDAKRMSRIAIRLDPSNEEALFTAGIIEYHDGSLDGGDHYLSRAEGEGKDPHLCLIQRGYGRLRVAESEGTSSRKWEILREAQDIFTQAREMIPDGRHYRRNVDRCEKGIKLADFRLPTRLSLNNRSRTGGPPTIYSKRRSSYLDDHRIGRSLLRHLNRRNDRERTFALGELSGLIRSTDDQEGVKNDGAGTSRSDVHHSTWARIIRRFADEGLVETDFDGEADSEKSFRLTITASGRRLVGSKGA